MRITIIAASVLLLLSACRGEKVPRDYQNAPPAMTASADVLRANADRERHARPRARAEQRRRGRQHHETAGVRHCAEREARQSGAYDDDTHVKLFTTKAQRTQRKPFVLFVSLW